MSLDGWRDQAACEGLDTNMFFPTKGLSSKPARAVCAECPVEAECLDFALVCMMKHGVWGGTTDRMRRKVRYGTAVLAGRPNST